MKHILFLLLFLPVLAFAQFPANPNKIRLGNQTTADGLVVRTAASPSWTPSTINNAWLAFDTVAVKLYYYDGGAWNEYTGGSEITDVSVSNDTLYITTTDSTFVAVFDDANTNFANSNLTFTGNRVHNLSTRTLTIADGGTYPTFQQSAATDGITLASSATDIIAQTPGLLQIENSDTITITSDRIRMNAADTRIQQVAKDNALNRLVALDSLTGQLKYVDKSSISSGGTVTGTGTTGTIPVWSSSSALGDSPLTVSSGSVIAGGTGFFRFPVGTTAQRPGTPQSGDARYNTTNGVMEWYGASAWKVPVESASATGMGTANLVSAFDANGRLGDSRYRQNFVADWNTVSDKEIAILNWAGTGAPVDGSGASGINIPHTSSTFGWQLASSSNADALYYRRKQAGTWQSWVRIDNTLSVQSTSGVLGFLPVYDGTITGLTASRFKNTIGTTFNINETNFQFIGYTGTDAPAGGGGAYGAYFPHQSSALYGWQLAADAGGNRFYFRNKNAGTWQSWRRVTTGTLTTGTVGNVAIWGAVGELSENASFFWDTANTRLGIGTNTPARTLHVTGEARITDLTTDDPTRIVGADADGDLGAITVGSGLSLSSGTLSATGGTGTTNLAFSGASSPVTLTSDTGTDVIFAAGSGLALSQSGGTATYSRTYSLIHTTITGGSTFFGTTAERPDNDTPGSATTSTVGSNFSVSGSTIDYTGGSGALIRVEGSISFSVADDGDYYLSLYKEGTEIGATSMRISCVAGNYYSVSLPATTVTGNTNDTFDLRIATVSGNSTTTMHRYGYIIERVY